MAAISSLTLIFILFISTLSISTSSSSSSTRETISRFQDYLRLDTAHPNPNYTAALSFLLPFSNSIPGLQSQTLEFVPGKPVLLVKWPGSHPSLSAVLLNSHTDVVPAEPAKWGYHPFSAALDPDTGNIFARGSQDMKCVGLQYLEAIRRLKAARFVPKRTVYVSFVPDEEIGGHDGAEEFAKSEFFGELNVGIVLDEGLASESEEFRVFYGERSPWWMVIKAVGAPGHGAKMYDGSAMENLQKSLESIRRFREAQFGLVKSGEKAEGDVISVNPVFLKAGTPTPTGFVMNLQPSEAEAGFDIRVPPTANAFDLEKRIAEEWAPKSRNMTYEFKQKVPVCDKHGNPAITKIGASNPWWVLLEEAVKKAGGKLSKPEIFPAATDARYFREKAFPAIGFSPMANTPILLHDHNEFLNQDVYLKGIEVYEAIIEAYASYDPPTRNMESRAEL